MKELFANPNIGLIGLIFFFTFFCVMSFWVYRPGSKKQYQDHANIPLQENE